MLGSISCAASDRKDRTTQFDDVVRDVLESVLFETHSNWQKVLRGSYIDRSLEKNQRPGVAAEI